MQHRDKIALEKIVNAIEEALEVFGNVSEENFLQSKTLKLAMAMSVIRIGELVKTLTMEFREKNSQVEWKAIAGFSDIAAHKYDVIDMKILYYSVKNELPELKRQIEKILAND